MFWFRTIGTILFALGIISCQAKISTEIRASSDKRGGTAPETESVNAPSPTNAIDLTAPGAPQSIQVSNSVQSKAALSWASAPIGGVGTVTQSILLYSGADASCSAASPAATISGLSGSAVSALWDRFVGGVSGLVRFKVVATDSKGTSLSSACSGSVYLRNGVYSFDSGLTGASLTYQGSADINGDGVKDLVFSDASYDSGKGVIVAYISVAGSMLDWERRVYSGDNANDQVGSQVVLGDITGDGKADIVSSNPAASPTSGASAGSIYIITGASSLPASAAISVAGRRYDGDSANKLLGSNLQLKDVNGDGINDVISNYAFTDAYTNVQILPGSTTLPASNTISAAGGRVYMNDPNSDSVFTRNFFIEDVTGDGIPDLLSGDAIANGVAGGNWRGCVSVIPMASTLPASGAVNVVGRVYCGSANTQGIGSFLSTYDVNGDGIKDILVGGFNEYDVIFGAAAGSLPTSGTMSVKANRRYTGFSSVRPVFSDLNGDGVLDLIISDASASPSAKAAAGSVFVVLGGAAMAASGAIGTVANRRYDGDLAGDRLSLYPQFDWVFKIVDIDINGDGYKDLVGYSEAADPGGRTDAGSIYVLLGAAALPASAAISTAGRRYDGAAANDGIVLGGIYDVTGDSKPDIVFHSVHSPNGQVGIIPGNTTMPASGLITAVAAIFDNDGTGIIDSLSTGTRDLNGDGKVDLIFTGDDSGGNGVGNVCILPGAVTMSGGAGLVASGGSCFLGDAAGEYLTIDRNHIFDINNDGFKDLVVSRGTGKDRVDVIYGSSTLSNLTTTSIVSPALGDSTGIKSGITPEDLDGDGKYEMIWSDGEGRFMPNALIYP